MTNWRGMAGDLHAWARAWPSWAEPDVDGYPSSTPGNGTQGVGGGGISRPTEAAVLQRERQQDTVRAATTLIVGTWELVADMLRACTPTAPAERITRRPATMALTIDTLGYRLDVVHDLEQARPVMPAVCVTAGGEIIVQAWAETVEVLVARHRQLARLMPPLRADVAAEVKAARCTGWGERAAICERMAVHDDLCHPCYVRRWRAEKEDVA